MKNYLKNDSWHNMFREHVIARVNEDIFSVLYSSDNGCPNASIRVLVGMMILKEGQGWSDEQLFTECDYNLLVRSALGLMNLTDTAPVPSTYYLFRKRVMDYNRENDTDLFKECMRQITKSQVLDFKVSGKQVRMDSKLIGSNITWYTRYELVHETLALFIEERSEHIHKRSLSQQEFDLIDHIMDEEGNKFIYRSNKKEVDTRFVALGRLMYRFIKLFKRHDYGTYQTLKAVFDEQFTVTTDKIVLPKENDEISAKSVQSPHDTDSHYRNKGGKKVKGYSANITETCDDPKDSEDEDEEQPLNLVTDVNLDVVSTPDCDFLEPSIEETRKLLDDKIEEVYADGAYNSPVTQDYANENDIDLILTGIQGQPPRYELTPSEENPDELIVLDTKTQLIITACLAATRKIDSQTGKPVKRWRVKTDDGKYRYFTIEDVRTSMLRQKLRDVPIRKRWKRNNVEATIFQLGYNLTNGKTRYRGLAANRLWAYSRATWINFRRILKYVMQASKRSLSSQKGLCFIINKWINIQNNVNSQINNFLNNSLMKYLNFSHFSKMGLSEGTQQFKK
ncbi:MAG: transposase [Tepidanaerobacteraceae bacterium]|nr:transposase [Tepidanaerobacteraceae bacterium]